MYSPDALLATLAFVASLSGLICAAVFLILPRAVRRARHSRKG